MATATLELVNPYAKYGLKRRPTYNEIANLISENETLTGTLPNRDATFFKKTPQGSFFDGTDHLEILKEEQNRIMERQMREMLLRQNARRNGTTFNVDRLSGFSTPASGGFSTPAEVQDDDQVGEMLSSQMQTELNLGQSRRRDRQQQTGEAHSQELGRQSRLPTLESFIGAIRGLGRTGADTPSDIGRTLEQQQEPSVPEFDIGTEDEGTDTGSQQQRQVSKLESDISYSRNISSWSKDQLAFQLYVRGVDVNSPEYEVPKLKEKGKGKGPSARQHYMNLAQTMIVNGDWDRRINTQLLQSRINEYYGTSQARSSKD